MSKIPTPTDPAEVDSIAFYAAPPFEPGTTAFEMLVYLMEQPWADVKRHRGQVIVSDLRHTVGGTVVAVYTENARQSAIRAGMSAAAKLPLGEGGKVLQFRRPREGAPA